MKILVLGNSDTAGVFSGGKTWSAIVADGLAERRDEPVELHEIGFSVLGPTAAPYAERKVRELEPELVILPVGTFAFTIGFVWKRVERLFGKRAGRRYKRLEDRFDASTRGRGTLRDGINRAGRATVRRLLGTQPLGTQREVTDGYARVITALARFEDAQVVLVAHAARGKHHHRRGALARRAVFLADVERAAQAHHFTWVNGDEAYADQADVDVKTRDGFHQNEMGHRLLGEHIVATMFAAQMARNELAPVRDPLKPRTGGSRQP
ncbi:MAG: hypothetical protein ACRDHF_05445 [Tepidiformaceae bacterium]